MSSRSRRATSIAIGLAVGVASLAIAGSAARSQRARAPTLALGGDVIFDAPILYAIDRFFDDRPAPALRELLADVAPTLAAADLAVVNLECPVAPRTHARGPDHDAPTFAAPTELLDAISAAGVDAAIVANNHAYDQGVEGLARTLEHAARSAVITIGAGRDLDDASRATILERGGWRIAIAAFTTGSNRRVRDADPGSPRIAVASEARIDASVRDARARADLVIVSVHWTTPFDDGRPTRGMERLVRAAAEAGADLVYAHGTHTPGPRGTIATRDGRSVPVLWSLGNLIAGMEEDDQRIHDPTPSVRDAVVARVSTRARDGGLAIDAIALEGFWITSPEHAWWAGSGASDMLRPLSIDGELARIERAACGERCARWAQSYRARAAMIARLAGGAGDGDGAGTGTGTGGGAGDGAGTEAETETGGGLASGRGSARGRRSVAPPPATIPDELARGAVLRITFPEGSAAETSIDRAQVRAIVELLLADRALRADIVVRIGEQEPAALALARAHRARGALAIHGPSRARFSLRADDARGRPSITIRLRR